MFSPSGLSAGRSPPPARTTGVASSPMSDDELDPGAPTQMFQAFMDRESPEASDTGPARTYLVAGVVVALLLALALAWVVLAG